MLSKGKNDSVPMLENLHIRQLEREREREREREGERERERGKEHKVREIVHGRNT